MVQSRGRRRQSARQASQSADAEVAAPQVSRAPAQGGWPARAAWAARAFVLLGVVFACAGAAVGPLASPPPPACSALAASRVVGSAVAVLREVGQGAPAAPFANVSAVFCPPPRADPLQFALLPAPSASAEAAFVSAVVREAVGGAGRAAFPASASRASVSGAFARWLLAAQWSFGLGLGGAAPRPPARGSNKQPT